MCSRYFLDDDGNIIAYTFRVPVVSPIRKRFNIAPTQQAPVVHVDRQGARVVTMMRWGLVPFWATDLTVGNSMINARSESVEEKPAFRKAFEHRRCLIPATGFFEWRHEGKRAQPFAVTVPDQPLFALAGLWERWKSPEGESVESYTILTTEANAQIASIHDRMPVIVPPEGYEAWLAGPAEQARAWLLPYLRPVTLRAIAQTVGNPRIDTPEVLADAPAEEPPAASRNGELF